MLQSLDTDPDQTALQLLTDFRGRYPDLPTATTNGIFVRFSADSRLGGARQYNG